MELIELKKGDIVTCKITTVTDNGIEVLVNDDVPGFIRRADLSRDRSEQRPNRFAAGELVDALVSAVDKPARKVGLSIKAREVQEEKIAMAEFGSSDSGASLGDILGAALKERDEISEVTEEVLNEKNVLPELDPIKGQSETLDSSISKDDTKKKNSKKVSKKKDSGKADDNV